MGCRHSTLPGVDAGRAPGTSDLVIGLWEQCRQTPREDAEILSRAGRGGAGGAVRANLGRGGSSARWGVARAGRGSQNAGERARPELGGGGAKEEAELTVVRSLAGVRGGGKGGGDRFSTADSSRAALPEHVLLAVRHPVLFWLGRKKILFSLWRWRWMSCWG